MPASGRAERDAGLRRVRSLNTGMVVVSVAAVGAISAAVAAATPGHASGVSQDRPSTTQGFDDQQGLDQTQQNQTQLDQTQQNQVPQQATQNVPPAATSGGS